MSNPKYNVGDPVYFRESAVFGFLESMTVSGVLSYPGGWMYTVQQPQTQITQTYGDRRSLVNNAILYFTENEFVSYCEALGLAKTMLEYQLAKINTLAQSCDT